MPTRRVTRSTTTTSSVAASIETITPETAKKLLDETASDTEVQNRKISKQVVGMFARDMESDKWTMTGEPIILNRKEKVLDGQHRLLAVLESQKSIPFLVVRGVENEAMHDIDTGHGVRSTAQILEIMGHRHAYRAVAVARYFFQARSNGTFTKLSTSELETEIGNHPGIKWIVSKPETAAGIGGNSGVRTTVTPILAAFAIFREATTRQEADRYWEDFQTGELREGDPFLALRKLLQHPLQGAYQTQTSSGRRELFRRTLNAIMKRKQGVRATSTEVSNEGLDFFARWRE